MKSNRLCAGLALLLCTASMPVCAQLSPSDRAERHAFALSLSLMACALTPMIHLLEAVSGRPRRPDDAGRMGVMQRVKHWITRGGKPAARFYWRVGLPFAFFVEGLGYIADRSGDLVAGGVLATSLLALVTALVYKLHISIDEQLAHWFVKLDALLGLDMENDERDYYLYKCVGDNRINRVKALLAHGANPNYAEWSTRITLQSAVRGGNPDMLAALLEYGANVEAQAFIDAVCNANPAVVDQLCQSDTAIDAVCDQGSTFWRKCVQREGPEMARLLASRGLLRPDLDSAFYPARQKGLQRVSGAELSKRKRCIERSLDRHNIPKDVAGLTMSFSDGPETLILLKRHEQVCDMLE